PGTEDHELFRFLVDAFRDGSRDPAFWSALQLEEVGEERGIEDARHALRRLAVFTDFCYTVTKGLLEERLRSGRSWFDLDDLDLRDWLRRWRAGDATVASTSGDAMYGSVFSSGAPGHGVGAGTILLAALRAAFSFRGAALYRPEGSIGDVVFAPLYEVLRRRGVRFEFFHRVERLELDA